MSYLEFFNLKEDPFGLTPDTDFFYPSKAHSDVLDSLDYAVEQKEGFSLVTGEPGTGKTTLLKIFIHRWHERAEVALILTPRLSGGELLQAVLDDLDIPSPANKNDQIAAFRDFLIDRCQAGKRVLIIVDEAQNLSEDALEELRLLSNLETEKEKLLQIILVGQPELLMRLQSEQLRQLHQRMTVKVVLRPLTCEELADYMAFRLIRAGTGSALIGDPVKRKIFKETGGTPRLINLLSSRTMMAAYIDSAHQIRPVHVRTAKAHLSLERRRRAGRFVPAMAVGAAMVVLAVLGFLYLGKGVSAKAVQPGKAADKVAAVIRPELTVAVDMARLREAPSLKAVIAGRVGHDERLVRLDEWAEQGGIHWYRVRTSSGKEGWIAGGTVREILPQVGTP